MARVIEGEIARKELPSALYFAHGRGEIDPQILEHLSEPETRHIIIFRRVRRRNVTNSAERNGGRQILVEASNSSHGVVQVLGLAGDTPCVEVGFEDFRAKDVVRAASGNIETVLFIEGELLGGGGSVPSVISVGGYVCERFWANAGAGNRSMSKLTNQRVDGQTYRVLA